MTGPPREPAARTPRVSSRTTLRWRLTLVYGAVAVTVGLLLLVLSVVLVNGALSRNLNFANSNAVAVELPNGVRLSLAEFQQALREQATGELLRQGLLALALLGGLGVGVAYLIAGRVLQPLQDITTAAQRLSVEGLDARIALAGPQDELKQLADTFDAMLGRLEAAFDAQRRFVADASHELRTPLAVMRTEVEVALADEHASAQELRQAAQVVREASIRADRLVDSLLLLARSDRLTPDRLPLRERVDLAVAAATAADAVREEVQQQGLRLAASYAPAPVLGDPGLLERLAGNLVENAVRHNVPGGWMRVDTGRVGDLARLEVSNSGPLLEADEVAGLFEPFRRHGTARTARRGAGLGLSIVRAVAAAHGGTAAASARPDGGLTVVVELPWCSEGTTRA